MLKGKSLVILVLIASISHVGFSQQQDSVHLFTDTLDQKFDFSEFMLSQSGFLPVVGLITEPALGFGAAGGAVFFNPFSKSRKKELRYSFGSGNPPDRAIAFGMGTANGTWGTGLAYKGYWLNDRLRYTGMVGWMSINLDYYGNENFKLNKPITFNYKGLPIVQGLDVRFFDRFFAGVQYVYFSSKIAIKNAELPDWISELELNSINSLITPNLYYDSRNNLMTPKKGLYIKVKDMISRKAWGATFNYDNMETFAIAYIPTSPNYVMGFRADYKGATENAPYYALPFVDLRGIPVMRYQGQKTLVLETEQTWYFNKRWAAVGFAGAGKAFNQFNTISENPVYFSGGAGFRYLGARLLGMYMGVDLAVGPEQLAVYIVFGGAWNRY